MEDSEKVEEGLAPEQEAPETADSPEVVNETDSPEGGATAPTTDSELLEFATNRGYSPEDLQDEKLQKALKMAHDNQKAIGKTNTPQVEESNDLDKLLEEILGESSTPETPQQAVKALEGIDESQLSEQDKATLEILKDTARKEAQRIIAPYQSELSKRQIKAEMNDLIQEYGEDVVKQAPAILAKTKTGVPLREATQSVLLEGLLKKQHSAGVEKGKEIKSKEISQQVEQTKKAEAKLSLEDFNKLSASEQYEVFKAAGLVK